MKKKSFFLLCLLGGILILSSCGGGNKKKQESSLQGESYDATANFKKNGLKGNVKSIRQRVYWALEKFGRMEKGKLQNMAPQDFLKVYNEYGLLIEETHFDIKKEVVSRRLNTYDKTNLIKEEFFDAKKCTSILDYTYNGNLLTQKDIQDGDGKLKERIVYSYYDGTQLLKDEDKYNSAGKLSQKIVHIYDGEKISEKQYYTGGGYPFKKEYMSYDEAGNLSVSRRFKYENKEEIYDGKTEYADYTSFGDYCSKIVYDKTDELVEVAQYSYNEHESLIEYSVSKPQKTPETTVIISQTETIDSDVQIVEEDEESEGGMEWELDSGAAYEYTYDKVSNWVTKVTYKIDEPGKKSRQFYYERIIEYR